MAWLSENIVGLLSIIFIMGGYIITLHVKTEINSGAIKLLTATQTAQGEILKDFTVRGVILEGQMDRFAKSNDRLALVLEKLDELYSSLKTADAVHEEKLNQTTSKVNKLENRLENLIENQK